MEVDTINDPVTETAENETDDHESEKPVESGKAKSNVTFDTSVQKDRHERLKQKRKKKRQKVMAQHKSSVSKKRNTESGKTANLLWEKLNSLKEETEQFDANAVTEAPVNYSIEDEPDPVKKAIREKKRDKRQKKKEEKQRKRQENLDRAGTAGPASIEYLHQWENNREEWKFNKRRQTWLIQNLYDQDKIDDDDFDILLRYLDPASDSTKESLVNEAEEVIKNIEKELEQEGDTDGVQVSNYLMDRARQIIQLLAT